MRALLVASLVALPALAAAQTARPGVDCSLLTRTQAHGLPCANAPRPDPLPDFVPSDETCRHVDAYHEPDKALACNGRPAPGDQTPTFLLGGEYRVGYDTVRARVIGITTDVDGVQVITFRWLQGDAGLGALRTPPTPGGATAWRLVERIDP